MSDSFLRANSEVKAQTLADAVLAKYKSSPVEWLLSLGINTRGAAGERMFAAWMTDLGFPTYIPRPKQYGDASVLSARGPVDVEVKLALLSGERRPLWQHLRIRDTDYDYLALLELAPDPVLDGRFWFIPKREAFLHSCAKTTSSKGIVEGKLDVYPHNVPHWLRSWGGISTEFETVVERELGSASGPTS